MKVQSIQSTPNPNAFKFLVDEVLWQGSMHYDSAEQSEGNDLAKKLFAIDGVDTLFFCDRFVTVSMTPAADWRAVHEQATSTIEANAVTVVSNDSSSSDSNSSDSNSADSSSADSSSADSSEKTASSAEDSALLVKINELLDDRVRPALANDGGGLEIIGLVGKTLEIRYQGACGSCPSSIAGTLTAIQSLLQNEIDSELSVVSA